MKTNTIIVAVVSFAIFSGLTWFCLPSRSDAAPATPAAPSTQPQIIVPYPAPYYYRDRSADLYDRAFEQYQRAADQRISAVERDLNTVDTDLRTLFNQTSKQDASVKDVLQKLTRIEQTLGNINGRLRKLEDKVDYQFAKLKKSKPSLAETIQEANEPNDVNKSSTNKN